MKSQEIYRLNTDKRLLVETLQSWKLIPEEGQYLCRRCGGILKIVKNSKYEEGYNWVCNNNIIKAHRKRERCNIRVSLRKGTFFENSRLSICEILHFVQMWVRNCQIQYIKYELEISATTAADWGSFFRDILYLALFKNREPLGGEGIVVEIDKSVFGPKKCQLVFGGYERGTGRVFLETVGFSKTDTLAPLIQKWIHPGSTVISDGSEDYDCLSKLGYKHLTTNFMDHPDIGVHTNSMKSTWRAAKAVMNQSGQKECNIPGNLAKYIFKKKCKIEEKDPFVEFLKLAGDLYNPVNPHKDNHLDFSDGGSSSESD